jgi:hypothetical protein
MCPLPAAVHRPEADIGEVLRQPLPAKRLPAATPLDRQAGDGCGVAMNTPKIQFPDFSGFAKLMAGMGFSAPPPPTTRVPTGTELHLIIVGFVKVCADAGRLDELQAEIDKRK